MIDSWKHVYLFETINRHPIWLLRLISCTVSFLCQRMQSWWSWSAELNNVSSSIHGVQVVLVVTSQGRCRFPCQIFGRASQRSKCRGSNSLQLKFVKPSVTSLLHSMTWRHCSVTWKFWARPWLSAPCEIMWLWSLWNCSQPVSVAKSRSAQNNSRSQFINCLQKDIGCETNSTFRQ